MKTKEFLQEICKIPSISGYEQTMALFIQQEFSKYCDNVHIDVLGNVIALKKGKGKNSLLLSAHMDEIGLMVSQILKGGFVKFVTIGGYDERTLLCQEVTIHGKKDIYGVIGFMPPHLSGNDVEKSIPISEMTIDTGYSQEELQKLISIGDIISIKREFTHLLHDRFAGRAFDDKAGVASLFASMKYLQDVDHELDVYFVASVQEEVGLRGAKTASYGVNPDMAIAVDVGFAKTPELSERESIVFGKGPSIAMGPNFHPNLHNILKETAKTCNIDHQIEVIAQMSGTDANIMQVQRNGIATALLSIPLKYMHTSVECICLADIQSTGRLIAEFIRHFNHKSLEEELCY